MRGGKTDDRRACVWLDWPKLTYLSERANGNSGRVPASTGADERRPTATATAAEPKSLIRRQQQRRLNERRREGSDGAVREGGRKGVSLFTCAMQLKESLERLPLLSLLLFLVVLHCHCHPSFSSWHDTEVDQSGGGGDCAKEGVGQDEFRESNPAAAAARRARPAFNRIPSGKCYALRMVSESSAGVSESENVERL